VCVCVCVVVVVDLLKYIIAHTYIPTYLPTSTYMTIGSVINQ
jgi:hypothetical protein